MAYTSDQLQNLETIIANAVESTSIGDKSVNYQRIKELKILRAEMQQELGVSAPRTQRAIAYPVTSKGLG